MNMDFFSKTGKMAIGSRLRLLTAKVTEEAAEVYQLYGADFAPKWFPVFYVLCEEGEKSISQIAQIIGHSQPSVSKIIAEMTTAGLVEVAEPSKDKRKTLVKLTEKGTNLSGQIRTLCVDVDAGIQSIMDEATHDLWQALQEWETLLDEKSLLQRVKEQKKRRESQDVRIVPYESRYQSMFRALNVEWISTYFEMEPADYKALDNPQEYILDKGGMIFVALYHDEPVGVCALIKIDDPVYDYELAKMAVSPAAKGKSIGWMLAQAAIQAAKEAGASNIYLDSNTRLKPAISLYEKLGFKKISGRPSPYKRVDIQMALDLTKNDFRAIKGLKE